MFLTAEQVEQLQTLCERIGESRTRSGRVIIEIRNNMPRNFLEELPIYDEIIAPMRFADVSYPIFYPYETYIGDDGIHPTEAGYEALARQVAAKIRELL